MGASAYPYHTQLLALAALVSLLGTTVLSLGMPEIAAWQPDHGHVTVGGVVPPHSHPWDASYGSGHSHDDMVFTFADHCSIASAVQVPAPLALLTPATTVHAPLPAPAPVHGSPSLDVPVPPPRATHSL